MSQIIQEVLLETSGPSTTYCTAPEPAVLESEMEVQAGHEPTRKLAVLLSKLLNKEGMQTCRLCREQVQRVRKIVLYSCCRV